MSTSMTDLILPTHQAVHHELEPYTELMQLLRALDNKAFIQLTKVYTDTMSKLYKRDLKRFFEEAKNKLICKRLQGIYVTFFFFIVNNNKFSFFTRMYIFKQIHQSLVVKK